MPKKDDKRAITIYNGKAYSTFGGVIGDVIEVHVPHSDLIDAGALNAGESEKTDEAGNTRINLDEPPGKHLMEIEDIKKSGAEEFRDALRNLAFILYHGGEKAVEDVFGVADFEKIIRCCSSGTIISGLDTVRANAPHIPEQGDIYTSKKTGDTIVIMSFDGDFDYVHYASSSQMATIKREEFEKLFNFTKKNIDVSEFVNILNKKGSNK